MSVGQSAVPSTMRAAVYHGRRDLRIEEVPTPRPRAGELLLRIRAAGVCGTDASEWERGPAIYALERHPLTGHDGPLIPGHELAGEVVGGDGAAGFDHGQLVACGAGFVVGEDRLTRSGRPHLSPWYATVGLHANGGFAQYCAVPARACLPIDGLTGDTAALAQPMAIAVHAVRQGRVQPQERAAIIGAGGIGAFAVAAASRRGAHVTAIDLLPDRLAIAARLGADATIDAQATDDLGALAHEDHAPDVVIEATGTASGLELALELATRGGRIVVVGLQDADRSIDLRRLSQREHELIGTNAHHGEVDLPEALRLLAERPGGWDDVAPIAVPLDEIVAEGLLPLVERRATRIKTLVDPWATTVRPADTAPSRG